MSLCETAMRTYRRRGLKYTVAFWVTTHLRGLWNAINHTDLVHSLVNESVVNQFVVAMEPRPARLSTMETYTSWSSLTDQTYSDRHLPPWPEDHAYPPPEEVATLFNRRTGPDVPAQKSTLLFPFFAQWFVDGFLRTDPQNVLKNRSNHQIDLSQLYGFDSDSTDALREGAGGRLKSQTLPVDGGEYPPDLCDANGDVKPEFLCLNLLLPPDQPGRHPDDLKGPSPGVERSHPTFLDATRRQDLFAVALPRGNIHYGAAMIGTIFLREHNRLAREIEAANATWDDERIFQTARATLIVILLGIVIEEYINHISPFHFRFVCEPGVGATRNWLRPNWMSIEFDMLYRWHTLVPSAITVGGQEREFKDVLWDMGLLRNNGVEFLVQEASEQACTEIGLLNTPDFLLPVELHTIVMGRKARLAGYNDYRQACGYPRLGPQAFSDVSSRADVQARLAETYDTVDDIELYPGLFAEDVDQGGVLPDLMGTMVGVDAFSQVNTSPLLDPRLYSAETFSEFGMQEIEQVRTLGHVVHNGLPSGGRPRVSFDRPQ